jgi:hypothetical protein
VTKKAMKAIVDGANGLEDEPSSEENPKSAARKKPIGNKQAKKGKKTGDDDLKNAMDAIVLARKKAAEERRLSREKESDAEQRRAVAE